MKRWAIRGLLALVAVSVLGLVAIGAVRSLTRAPGVPVHRIERSPFVRTVMAEGYLEAEQTTQLVAPNAMRQQLVIAWLAADGSEVDEDEVVVRFDPTEMEQNLLDGESEKDTALTRMDKQKLESGAVVANLDRDADIASRELRYAREFQSKDRDIFSRTEIIESEIDEDLATRRKDHAEQSRSVQGDLSRVELDLIELEKRRAELKIQRAEAGLESLEVRAPHAGIFVLKRDWDGVTEEGQTAWPGQPLAEIPLLDVMQAKVFVLEADAGGVEEGVEATVRLEAHPQRPYRATVKNVASLAQRRNHRSPVQYFEVILELEVTESDWMKPGQRVVADLHLENLDHALSVPRQAVINREDGGKIVYRRSGDGFEPVPVVLGTAGPGRVVIEEGLEEGDVIALADPTFRPEEATSSVEAP